VDSKQALSLTEDRFSRFRAIKWWDQSLLRDACVMVVGAGALGNEVIKNLSLLGVGWLLVVDMDSIETSNLSRSVLFRTEDQGKPKAVVAARAAAELYPDIEATALVGNVLADVGLGHFRWAQVVVGALDNREARVFVNRVCAQVGRPWIDGGIDVLSGLVRGFAPPKTACYECTMGQADWELLEQRRSCSLLARRAADSGGVPTTPTTASLIGAIQAQEVVKRLHNIQCLDGQGYVFEGLEHSSYTVSYPISADCPWHEPAATIEADNRWSSKTTLREIWDWAATKLGGLEAIDLSRELVAALECPECGLRRSILAPIDHIHEDQALCQACQAECVPQFVHSIDADSELLDLSASELGLPPRDIIWPRHEETVFGLELEGDKPSAPPAVGASTHSNRNEP